MTEAGGASRWTSPTPPSTARVCAWQRRSPGARSRFSTCLSCTGSAPPVRAVRSTPLEGLTTTDRRTVMIEFEKVPLQPFARIFAACPAYGEVMGHLGYGGGPYFPRHRTTGRPRVDRKSVVWGRSEVVSRACCG